MKSKKPEKQQTRVIGERSDGVVISEDGNGVRFYIENGIRVTEPVLLVPGRGGYTYQKGELHKDFMTELELNEMELKEIVKTSGKQNVEIVAFHGTRSSKVELMPQDFLGASMFGKGIYFTSSQADATKYASAQVMINHDLVGKSSLLSDAIDVPYDDAKDALIDREGRVIKAALTLNNPLHVGENKIDVQENVFLLAAAECDVVTGAQSIYQQFKASASGIEQFSLLQKHKLTRIYRQIATLSGFDSLVIDPKISPKGDGATHYLVLESNQVNIIEEMKVVENAEVIPKDDQDFFKDAQEKYEDVSTPEGFRWVNGKGPISHKWGLAKDGEQVAYWNYHNSKKEAVRALKEKLEWEAKAEQAIKEHVAFETDLVKRIRSGEVPSDKDIERLELKPHARFDYLSPVIQRLTGVKKHLVRKAMGDALYERTSDMGVKTTWGDTKKALAHAIIFESGIRKDSTDNSHSKSLSESTILESKYVFNIGSFKINILNDRSVSFFLANNTLAGPTNGWSLISTLEGYHFINVHEKIGIDSKETKRAVIDELYTEFVGGFNDAEIFPKKFSNELVAELVNKIKEIQSKSFNNNTESVSLQDKSAEITFLQNPKTEKCVDISTQQRQSYVDLYNFNKSNPLFINSIRPFLVENRFLVAYHDDGFPFVVEIDHQGTVTQLNHEEIIAVKEKHIESITELVEFVIPIDKQGKRTFINDEEYEDSAEHLVRDDKSQVIPKKNTSEFPRQPRDEIQPVAKSNWWELDKKYSSIYLLGKSKGKDYVTITKNCGNLTVRITSSGTGGEFIGLPDKARQWLKSRIDGLGNAISGNEMSDNDLAKKLRLVKGEDVLFCRAVTKPIEYVINEQLNVKEEILAKSGKLKAEIQNQSRGIDSMSQSIDDIIQDLVGRKKKISASLKFREAHLIIQEQHSIDWVLNIIKTDGNEFFSKVHSYIVQLEDKYRDIHSTSRHEKINRDIAVTILNQPYPESDSNSLSNYIVSVSKRFPEFSAQAGLSDDGYGKQADETYTVIESSKLLNSTKILLKDDKTKAWVVDGNKMVPVDQGKIGKIILIVNSIQQNPDLGTIRQQIGLVASQSMGMN